MQSQFKRYQKCNFHQEKNRLLSKYGQWAIVTGATSGVGLELATQIASAGLNVVINSRHLDKLKEVERQLKQVSDIENNHSFLLIFQTQKE